MKRHHFSIRTLLLIVISVLNILIAAPLGILTWQSFVNYHEAQNIRHVTETLHHFYIAKKYLSLERAASLSILYAPADSFEVLKKEIKDNRENSREELQIALEATKNSTKPEIMTAMSAVQQSYAEFQGLRIKFDAAIRVPEYHQDSALADTYFEKTTDLIDKIDSLIAAYSHPISLFNPEVTRQMRLTRFIWEISEYAGREYAILGQLIARNKFPGPEAREKLIALRGRIQYGLELTHGAIESSRWKADLAPALKEAETHYSMVFEQIKDVFYQPATAPVATLYPVTVEMWLQLASEAVGSIHEMTDAVLKINAIYVKEIEQKALQFIYISLLLFLSALGLSLYTWRFVTTRIINPVNAMAEALYRESKLSDQNIKEDISLDEIAKLEQVLEVFRENSRQLEEERDKAHAASVAKSEFLANMSHEIRTPMNVVVGISNILIKSKPLTIKQVEFIKTLQVSADSLLSLINDLLDFSKIEAQNFELEKTRFHLDKVISDLARLKHFKAQQKDLTFKTDIKGIAGKEYIGDPTRISQILINLCGNALKFTEKGSVILKVRTAPHTIPGYEMIDIEVIDTGIGIPQDKLASIFEKFTQVDTSVVRKYGGTGLGLAITKSLVDMMEGDIKVKSSSEGTIFYVRFPLKLKDQQSLFTPDISEKPAQGKTGKPLRKILLVEDYQPNALVAGSFLEDFGYRYDVAKNGQEAVYKFMENGYDAILMDVQMPVMDGYEATRIIRDYERKSGQHGVKIIGFTAHASARDKEKCLAAGMDAYLPKPFEQKQLEKVLQG